MHRKPDKISDLDIQALVDGELDEEQTRVLHKAISKNRLAHARYIELKQQKDMLREWWETFKQEN